MANILSGVPATSQLPPQDPRTKKARHAHIHNFNLQKISSEISDEKAEVIARAFKAGEEILTGVGKHVYHAVNAIGVDEEPEELGDFECAAGAAKRASRPLLKY